MRFFGVSMTTATRGEMLATCRAALAHGAGAPLTVVTPNPEILLKARRDPAYVAALNRAALRIPDGMGLYLAAQLLDLGWPRWAFPAAYLWSGFRLFWARRALYEQYGQRLAGSDLTAAMLREADARGLSVAVVEEHVVAPRTPGDVAKVAREKETVEILGAKYPGVKKFELVLWNAANPAPALEALRAAACPLAVCTLGAPVQERAVLEIAAACPGVRLALAVGGSLDFECGFVKRAPKILRAAGLEWLWRLALEPRKRARRIWDAVVRFPLAALSEGE